MRLLIAEDNEQMRNMIKTIMTHPTNFLFECADGESAVVMYDRVRPDCVLMDVMKPIDGITATRMIKALHPEAKIIIVTNYGDKRTRAAAAQAGADGFVEKENLVLLRTLVDEVK
jgi:Response regulator containing a CheY-like receiver domain and an HTH DNA-binding domain